MKQILILLVLLAYAQVAMGAVQMRAADVERIVQLVLDLPELQGFLHPEVEGRVPVILAHTLIGRKIVVSKFGRSVRIVPLEEMGDRPFLEFTRLIIQRQEASVEFRYPIEGVVGRVKLKQTNAQTWIVDRAEIVEQGGVSDNRSKRGQKQVEGCPRDLDREGSVQDLGVFGGGLGGKSGRNYGPPEKGLPR